MLADGLKNASFLTALAELIEKGTAIAGETGELRGLQTTAYSKLSPESVAGLTPKPVGAEQSNTSIIYGNRLILKFFRRIQEGHQSRSRNRPISDGKNFADERATSSGDA